MEQSQPFSQEEHSQHHPHHHPSPEIVEFHVNEKPVRMEGHRHTGLQIKQAAKDQGVKIELDFLLYLLRYHQPNQLIADGEEVHLTHESRFHAIADDDNS
jgi:thioredoxin reductase